jgi:hypothetical protein
MKPIGRIIGRPSLPGLVITRAIILPPIAPLRREKFAPACHFPRLSAVPRWTRRMQ